MRGREEIPKGYRKLLRTSQNLLEERREQFLLRE
jgi:hypothetical protein